MAETQTSYSRIIQFINTASKYLERDSKRREKGERKFSWAVRKLLKKAQRLWTTFTELTEDAMMDAAAVEPATMPNGKDKNPREGLPFKDVRDNYERKKGEEQARLKKVREAFHKEDVPFEPHFVSPDGIPKTLMDEEIEAFEGFVIEDAEAVYEAAEPVQEADKEE